MNEVTNLILALIAGGLLGAIFFGGLWWTVQRGVSSECPAIWFFCSLLLRTSIAVTGFYFVSHANWRRLMACLLGFFLARILVTRFTRVPAPKRDFVIQGSRT
jgi:F1F0 ATPase subunit 2